MVLLIGVGTGLESMVGLICDRYSCKWRPSWFRGPSGLCCSLGNGETESKDREFTGRWKRWCGTVFIWRLQGDLRLGSQLGLRSWWKTAQFGEPIWGFFAHLGSDATLDLVGGPGVLRRGRPAG